MVASRQVSKLEDTCCVFVDSESRCCFSARCVYISLIQLTETIITNPSTNSFALTNIVVLDTCYNGRCCCCSNSFYIMLVDTTSSISVDGQFES